MSEPNFPSTSQTLLFVRIVWSALLLGEVVFLAVLAVTAGRGHFSRRDIVMLLLGISSLLLLVFVPLGYFVRGQCYKRHWRGDVVEPMGYLLGNTLLLAMCEGVVLFSLLSVLVTGLFLPLVLPGLVAMAVQLINYPHGHPMRAAGSVQ